ncbi:unnamed protein product [Moneuplotes crassus]|uniref:Uncharacterized protein n=1 Tax=Euplotes crassus TaxID=5936 RepID=A0AAD1XPF9_EUPCR|nr:unnamed protein product [Moneuplotes crassus]
MPGSKSKYKPTLRTSHLDLICGKKRNRDDDYENRDSNVMSAKDENTVQRKLKRGIRNARRTVPNPAEVASASKNFFLVSSNGKFTSQSRFKTDVGKISHSEKNKLSSILGKADLDFIQLLKEEENNDALRELEEFPVPVENIYNNPLITGSQLGRGVQVTLEFKNNKVRRRVNAEEEQEIEDDQEEEILDDYRHLHEKLREVERKYKKPSEEIADIYVKVSGDFENLERYFQGENVILWSYLEDLALTKSEDSMEYKCLIESKGKSEIEKRKRFLLKSEQNDPEY